MVVTKYFSALMVKIVVLKSSSARTTSELSRSQQTQNICISFVQCRPNVFNIGLTLYKCNTNLCVWWDNKKNVDGTDAVLYLN